MAHAVLTAPQFLTEAAAFAYVEAALWPHGPHCPHCGETARIGRLQGKTTQPGLHKCYSCKGHFTVRVGTLFEDSHLPLHLWLQIIHLMCASKKGIATRQIQRMLDCSMKTAWFLGHRIREAMKPSHAEPMGGVGETVEVDETYHGSKDVITKRTKRGKASHSSKRSIVTLVQRGGKARTFHVERADKETIKAIMREHIARTTEIHTDESRLYIEAGDDFAGHHTVMHTGGEYVRYERERVVHTNSAENYFSVFKRGMVGVYQHCSEKHLCQSACNRDPGSASKRDPPFRRFERLARAPSELVGVAETGRARVVG